MAVTQSALLLPGLTIANVILALFSLVRWLPHHIDLIILTLRFTPRLGPNLRVIAGIICVPLYIALLPLSLVYVIIATVGFCLVHPLLVDIGTFKTVSCHPISLCVGFGMPFISAVAWSRDTLTEGLDTLFQHKIPGMLTKWRVTQWAHRQTAVEFSLLDFLLSLATMVFALPVALLCAASGSVLFVVPIMLRVWQLLLKRPAEFGFGKPQLKASPIRVLGYIMVMLLVPVFGVAYVVCSVQFGLLLGLSPPVVMLSQRVPMRPCATYIGTPWMFIALKLKTFFQLSMQFVSGRDLAMERAVYGSSEYEGGPEQERQPVDPVALLLGVVIAILGGPICSFFVALYCLRVTPAVLLSVFPRLLASLSGTRRQGAAKSASLAFVALLLLPAMAVNFVLGGLIGTVLGIKSGAVAYRLKSFGYGMKAWASVLVLVDLWIIKRLPAPDGPVRASMLPGFVRGMHHTVCEALAEEDVANDEAMDEFTAALAEEALAADASQRYALRSMRSGVEARRGAARTGASAASDHDVAARQRHADKFAHLPPHMRAAAQAQYDAERGLSAQSSVSGRGKQPRSQQLSAVSSAGSFSSGECSEGQLGASYHEQGYYDEGDDEEYYYEYEDEEGGAPVSAQSSITHPAAVQWTVPATKATVHGTWQIEGTLEPGVVSWLSTTEAMEQSEHRLQRDRSPGAGAGTAGCCLCCASEETLRQTEVLIPVDAGSGSSAAFERARGAHDLASVQVHQSGEPEESAADFSTGAAKHPGLDLERGKSGRVRFEDAGSDDGASEPDDKSGTSSDWGEDAGSEAGTNASDELPPIRIPPHGLVHSVSSRRNMLSNPGESQVALPPHMRAVQATGVAITVASAVNKFKGGLGARQPEARPPADSTAAAAVPPHLRAMHAARPPAPGTSTQPSPSRQVLPVSAPPVAAAAAAAAAGAVDSSRHYQASQPRDAELVQVSSNSGADLGDSSDSSSVDEHADQLAASLSSGMEPATEAPALPQPSDASAPQASPSRRTPAPLSMTFRAVGKLSAAAAAARPGPHSAASPERAAAASPTPVSSDDADARSTKPDDSHALRISNALAAADSLLSSDSD